MSVVVSSPWERLCVFDVDQRRFLQACLGRETDPLIPFGGPATTLRAAPRTGPPLPPQAVRLTYVAADGREHLEAVLGRGELLALGIGPWIFQFGSEALVADVLAAMLADSLEAAQRRLGCEASLRVQRMAANESLPELPWPAFLAEGVPTLGRLRFRLSPALVEACEAQPMPRRSPDGMRHIPLTWDVRLSCIGLERGDCRQLARGDVVRVLVAPQLAEGVVGSMVPHVGSSLPVSGASCGVRRWVKVQIGKGGWITLRFEAQDKQAEYEVDDDKLNGAIVPVNLTLPVASMSLHEIDSAGPGTLVDTGVRLQDVEVTLWSAGYRFATGRLVVIGQHLGVEISRTERDLP